MNEIELFELGVKGLIKKDGKYLLLKRPIEGAENGFLWDLAGGLLEKGESVEETLVREVKEETGFDVEVGDFLHAFMNDPKFTFNNSQRIIFIYHCIHEEEQEIKLSREHEDFQWFTPEDAAKHLSVRYPKPFTHKL